MASMMQDAAAKASQVSMDMESSSIPISPPAKTSD
jgi:hypothetical protein